MAVNLKCPFHGAACWEKRCVLWATSVKTENATGRPIVLETCAINMIPDMLRDVIKHTHGTKESVEERGNETIKRQDAMYNQQELLTRIMGGMAQISLERIGSPETKGALGAGPEGT